MPRLLRSLGVSVVVAILFAEHAFAETPKNWHGRQVLVKTPAARLKIGKDIVAKHPGATVLQVQQVKSGWLWLGDGWIQAADVVCVDTAVAFFTEQIDRYPCAFAYSSRAAAYLARGQFDEASADLERAFEIQEKLWDRIDVLAGDVDLEMKRLTDSLRELDEVVGRTDQGTGSATGDLDEGIQTANSIIRSFPDNSDGYFIRAGLYMQLGLLDKAIADFDSAIRIAPGDAEVFDSRAAALEKKGDLRAALKDLDEAARLDPTSGQFITHRGLIYLELGNESLALKDFVEATELEPSSPLPYLMLATTLAIAGSDEVRDGKRAIEAATKACEITEWKASPYLVALGAAYAESGDFESAIDWEKKAQAIGGTDPAFIRQSQERLNLYRLRQPYRERLAAERALMPPKH